LEADLAGSLKYGFGEFGEPVLRGWRHGNSPTAPGKRGSTSDSPGFPRSPLWPSTRGQGPEFLYFRWRMMCLLNQFPASGLSGGSPYTGLPARLGLFKDGAWKRVDSTDVGLSGKELSAAAFKSRFGDLPPLQDTAFNH
jgi:hypothetical protein